MMIGYALLFGSMALFFTMLGWLLPHWLLRVKYAKVKTADMLDKRGQQVTAATVIMPQHARRMRGRPLKVGGRPIGAARTVDRL